jgi:AhpC/TSA family protein
VWQALYDELRDLRFVVIAIALDKSADDARPWIEKAAPTYPVLIDTQHVVADLYNIVNVPTALWIDERGRIVRPNDVVFGTDTFKHITNLESARPLAAVRAWARGERSGFAASETRGLQTLPTALDQQARAEFGLAEWLARHGARDAAERHFVRAGELAPHDFTIRRGSMPIRGIDPMGPQFREMLQAWVGGGRPYYRPLPDTRG